MQKLITVLAMVLLFQTSNASNHEYQISDTYSNQKTKKALIQLIRNQILVINPEDNSVTLNLENDTTKSLLEELNSKGLLNEATAGRGPICD